MADKIQLAASNIGWGKEDDETVYAALRAAGFAGLEIAPTRIFPQEPYENLSAAALFGGYLLNRWGLRVPSMQSIWYGRTGSIFDPAQAEDLLAYTGQAFAFAHALNCPSLVFGCPKNRFLPKGADPAAADVFFDKAGRLAARYGVRLALEANTARYTNFLNRTADVFALVKRLDNPGLAVNLDLGAMIENGERLRDFIPDLAWVSHIHISMPGLAPVERRPEYEELALLLKAVGYRGFVSIEMANPGAPAPVLSAIQTIAEVFQ